MKSKTSKTQLFALFKHNCLTLTVFGFHLEWLCARRWAVAMPTVETKLSRHGSLRSCFVGNRKEFFFYIYLFFSDDGKVVLSFYLEIDANDFTWNDNFRIWFSFMSLLYQSKTETINKYLGYRNNWFLLHNLSLLRVCALTFNYIDN